MNNIFKDLGFRNNNGLISTPDSQKLNGQTYVEIKTEVTNDIISIVDPDIPLNEDVDGMLIVDAEISSTLIEQEEGQTNWDKYKIFAKKVLPYSKNARVKRMELVSTSQTTGHASISIRFYKEGILYNPGNLLTTTTSSGEFENMTVNCDVPGYDSRYNLGHAFDIAKDFISPTYTDKDYYASSTYNRISVVTTDIVFNDPTELSDIVANVCPNLLSRSTTHLFKIYDEDDVLIKTVQLDGEALVNKQKTANITVEAESTILVNDVKQVVETKAPRKLKKIMIRELQPNGVNYVKVDVKDNDNNPYDLKTMGTLTNIENWRPDVEGIFINHFDSNDYDIMSGQNHLVYTFNEAISFNDISSMETSLHTGASRTTSVKVELYDEEDILLNSFAHNLVDSVVTGIIVEDSFENDSDIIYVENLVNTRELNIVKEGNIGEMQIELWVKPNY